MPRRDHVKHVGLTDTIETYLRRRPIEETFVTADLTREVNAPTKSVSRALAYLLRQGFIRVIGTRHGPTCKIYVYQRTGLPRGRPVQAKPEFLPDEHPGTVKRNDMGNGVTRVSFGLAWKPHREKSEARPWRGYESGLAWI